MVMFARYIKNIPILNRRIIRENSMYKNQV